MKIVYLPAIADVAFGRPVQAGGEGCAETADLSTMIGVAKRRTGPGPGFWRAGEPVPVLTDGGCKVELAENCDLSLGGIAHRLLAFDAHYFEIREGKIIGFG
jgi:hypothetical protein